MAFTRNFNEIGEPKTSIEMKARQALSARILSRLDQITSIAIDLNRAQDQLIAKLFGEDGSGDNERTSPVECFESVVMHRLDVLQELLTSANSNAARLSADL